MKISMLAIPLILFSFQIRAQLYNDDNVMKSLLWIGDDKSKIEYIDNLFSRASFRSLGHSTVDQLIKSRSVACRRAPEACLNVERWAALSCSDIDFGNIRMFSRLWFTAFSALDTEKRAHVFYEKMKKCNKKASASQITFVFNLYEYVSKKGWKTEAQKLLKDQEHNFLHLDLNRKELFANLAEAIPEAETGKAIVPEGTLALASGIVDWSIRQKEKIDADVALVIINKVLRIFEEAGSGKMILKTISTFQPIFSNSAAQYDRYLVARSYCNVERELGNLDKCDDFLKVIYKSGESLDFKIESARNLFERGKFYEAEKAYAGQLELSKGTGWYPWVVFFIAQSQIYQKKFVEAQANIEKFSELIKGSAELDRLSESFLRVKMLRFQNKFTEAYDLAMSQMSIFKTDSDPIWQKFAFNYELLLAAKGMGNNENIKAVSKNLSKLYTDDPIQKFRKVGIEIIGLNGDSPEIDKKVEAIKEIKGKSHPDVLDLINVLK